MSIRFRQVLLASALLPEIACSGEPAVDGARTLEPAAAGAAPTPSGGSPSASGGAESSAGTPGASGASTAAGGANTAGAGGTLAAAGTAGAPPMPRPDGGCSEEVSRTGPPAGKEVFFAEPIDEAFAFSSHWIGAWCADTEPRFMGMTALADFDNDGDLDFAAGQRHSLPGGMCWWERCSDDHWVTHFVGTGHQSDSSGDALDVNQDGFIDLVVGDSWYENPGNPRESEWTRHDAGTPVAEELIVGDITGDGLHEILYLHSSFDPQWWSPGPTPSEGFQLGLVLSHPIQQGGAWGDLNGDGANDYLLGREWWFENNGDGTAFTEHETPAAFGFDPEPLTYIGDLDGDGDNDYAMGTHWLGDGNRSRLAWVENLNGEGTDWEMHMLTEEKVFAHGVVIADFDNDRDLDILFAQNVGPSFIFENTDAAGTFLEHQIVDEFRGHTPRVGDVDCDGDLDIAGGPWGDRNQVSTGESMGEPIRDYAFLKNELVENGGPPLFERQPYELGALDRDHCVLPVQ